MSHSREYLFAIDDITQRSPPMIRLILFFDSIAAEIHFT